MKQHAPTLTASKPKAHMKFQQEENFTKALELFFFSTCLILPNCQLIKDKITKQYSAFKPVDSKKKSPLVTMRKEKMLTLMQSSKH